MRMRKTNSELLIRRRPPHAVRGNEALEEPTNSKEIASPLTVRKSGQERSIRSYNMEWKRYSTVLYIVPLLPVPALPRPSPSCSQSAHATNGFAPPILELS